MKVAWTSPQQVPGIQRWGVLPLFFCAAGAVAGPTGQVLFTAIPRLMNRTYEPEIWALIDGSIGLGIGMGVVLVRWAWVRILVTPVLALCSLLVAAVLYRSRSGEYDPIPLSQLLEDTSLRGFWLLHSASLVSAHLIWLRFAPVRDSLMRGVMLYLGIGGLSGMGAVWMSPGLQGSWASGGLAGIVDGIAQLTAMAAAQAFSGLRPREEGGGP